MRLITAIAFTSFALLACAATTNADGQKWRDRNRGVEPVNDTPFAHAAAYNANNSGTSLVVMQNGSIVFEDYPNKGSASKAWNLASGTKSFTGIIAATAVQDGILSLDEKVSDTIISWKNDARSDITIRDLLTLTSGIKTPTPFAEKIPTYLQATTYPSAAPRDTQFAYGPASFQIFGEVMRRKLQPLGFADPLDYLTQKVLTPIGVTPTAWKRGKDNMPYMPRGAELTARDWAKVGQFILDDGRVAGQQILNPEAMSAFTQGTKANNAYGLSFWLMKPVTAETLESVTSMTSAVEFLTDPEARKLPDDLFLAAGAGDQRLYIIPSLNMVIVRQAPITLRGMRQSKFEDVKFLKKVLGIE